jgi:hypothetical protein
MAIYLSIERTPLFGVKSIGSSSLEIGVAELARVQVFGILANSATQPLPNK